MPAEGGAARDPDATLVDIADRAHPTTGNAPSVSNAALSASVVSRGRRLHAFLIVLFSLVAIGLVVDGDRSTFALVALACIGVGILSSAVQLVWVKTEAQMRLRSVLPLSAPVVPGAIVATYYVGCFSPIFGIVPIALYVIASAVKRPIALMSYAHSVLITAVPMFAVAFGVVPDVGRVRAVADRPLLVAFSVLMQILLGGVYLLGRTSHRAVEQAVLEVERAVREVNQREALLGEANQDLDRVLHARAGRATGTKVGAWKLGGLLGRGGMGDVYEARHEGGDRRAAVKLLPEEAMADPDLVARFRREADALRLLDHPHVVSFIEVGDAFLAMELLDGSDLAAILRRRRALPLAEVVTMVAQVTSALEAARRAEIVHRDVKPQNLFFVEARQSWKVLDFGLSKLGESGGTLTQGMTVGTPTYMAPEQIESRPVDHRTDVFSLGVVAYRAITGQPAFSGEDNAKIMFDVLYKQPSRPSEIVRMPEDVDYALALALAKSPDDRIATAVAFSEALESASRGQLSAQQRTRARALVAKHPWGQRVA